MSDFKAVHRVPEGLRPQADAALARLFGGELVQALAQRRQQAGEARPAVDRKGADGAPVYPL